VFLHVEERFGGVMVARGELFRVLGAQIAEHWSAHVIDKTPRRNPHGTFAGPQVDAAKTTAASYARTFDELDRRGFGEFELATFYLSRTPDYIQHSPTGRDTVEGLVQVLATLRERGIRMTIDIKRTLAEGDFLVSHRLYRTDPPFPEFRTINVFDLFRLRDDGRAAEHWDIMEEVESEADLDRLF
jgi:predicted SnoaL-like aldol condensation-catalyzing enzyme